MRESRRLTITLVAVSVAVSGLLYVLLTWQPRREARRGFEAKATALSELVAYGVRAAVEFSDAETAKRHLDTAKRGSGLAYLALKLPDGNVLATTDAKLSVDIPGLLNAGTQTTENEAGYHVGVPVVSTQGKAVGWLQAGFDTGELAASMAQSARISLLVALLVGVVVFFLLYGVLSRAAANRLLLGEIAATVDNLRKSSSNIILACNELGASATQQAGAIEETRRTMVSLLDAAGRIADSSRAVFENADQTAQGTGTAAAAIRVLTEQAQKIGEISEVIRSISDKSDLLALNASLEGTRAGEAGKGFALVALEMRRLAESVMEAAREIKLLSSNIRSASDSSVSAVEQGRALAGRTSESAREITLVTQQQKLATEQVTRSMDEVRELLTRSAENTTHAESTARELANRADQLSSLTARFAQSQGLRGG